MAVTSPERRSSFRRCLDALGWRNVTEFNYRMSGSREAHIFVGVSVHGRDETARIVRRLARAGCGTLDLSDNEMAKEHLRHMVGGRMPVAAVRGARPHASELLYRFEFPERQGALMKFLRSMNPTWNIS